MVLQWGRAPMSAERVKVVTNQKELEAALLQWGRAPMSAESRRRDLRRRIQDEASMGPRSDERGKSGRARRSPGTDSRFNGAALR